MFFCFSSVWLFIFFLVFFLCFGLVKKQFTMGVIAPQYYGTWPSIKWPTAAFDSRFMTAQPMPFKQAKWKSKEVLLGQRGVMASYITITKRWFQINANASKARWYHWGPPRRGKNHIRWRLPQHRLLQPSKMVTEYKLNWWLLLGPHLIECAQRLVESARCSWQVGTTAARNLKKWKQDTRIKQILESKTPKGNHWPAVGRACPTWQAQ